jgi:hypothetical protein
MTSLFYKKMLFVNILIQKIIPWKTDFGLQQLTVLFHVTTEPESHLIPSLFIKNEASATINHPRINAQR